MDEGVARMWVGIVSAGAGPGSVRANAFLAASLGAGLGPLRWMVESSKLFEAEASRRWGQPSPGFWRRKVELDDCGGVAKISLLHSRWDGQAWEAFEALRWASAQALAAGGVDWAALEGDRWGAIALERAERAASPAAACWAERRALQAMALGDRAREDGSERSRAL
jgi:hypothetical protein